MGMPTGFIDIPREEVIKRSVEERIRDYSEIEHRMPEEQLRRQSSRCMNCGIPYCHNMGCPLKNMIPEINDLIWRGHWREALELLHSTNNFPEFTGRLCPALCEASCTLGVIDSAVSVRQGELHLVEAGWSTGAICPMPSRVRLGKRVAVVGSGPSGLAVAQQASRMGYDVVVYESARKIGGLLRYGIPDFKLEKHVIDRRLEQMRAEGVVFETGVKVGEDISLGYLRRSADAVVLCCGAKIPRDLNVEGRETNGIHFAVEYLTQQNKRVSHEEFAEDPIDAKGKNVLVIGGGDTGADCVGTAIRQGARSVTQIEIMPKPPETRAESTPWPLWPYMLRTGASHQEGCVRRWSLNTKSFEAKDGSVCRWNGEEVEMKRSPEGRMSFVPITGTEQSLDVELILLALGFTNEGNDKIYNCLEIKTQKNGLPVLDCNMMTSEEGVFAAGDFATGQSLVVKAIANARRVASGVDCWLKEQK
ncbi:glutamate synthase subunit beta [Candidatus Sumerlaeota bacterium]|nr:glutamate synthase subunit beta [Candidatus Sumerlaeota bacterium]